MSEAKDSMLENIGKALNNVPGEEHPEEVEVFRDYRQKGTLSKDKIAKLFLKRVDEYKATVKHINQKALTDSIAESCRRENVESLVIPEGFPKELIPDFINPIYDNLKTPLSNEELDNSDGVITTCALAVSQTGTIILDAGKGQGRRVLTLLPDYHLCIVGEGQLVELVPEGFAHLESSVKNEGPPLTFISGPSATSDIELSRVEGVHGPRRLEVLLYRE